MHNILNIVYELQFKVIEEHGGGVVEIETLKQTHVDKENGTSSKNKIILQRLKELGYDIETMDSTTISNIRDKIEGWLAKDKEYQESLRKLKAIFMEYINK